MGEARQALRLKRLQRKIAMPTASIWQASDTERPITLPQTSSPLPTLNCHASDTDVTPTGDPPRDESPALTTT